MLFFYCQKCRVGFKTESPTPLCSHCRKAEDARLATEAMLPKTEKGSDEREPTPEAEH